MGWHDAKQAKCFYIPLHDVIIAELTRASHSIYGVLDSPDILNVARRIAKGQPAIPELGTPTMAPVSIQWIDYKDRTLTELVGSCQEFSRLDKIVMTSIQALLQQVNNEKLPPQTDPHSRL